MVSATPGDLWTTPQHLRHGTCKDSNVRLRGHTWPRRTARLRLSPRGFRLMREDRRIHALGRVHIGGIAYFVRAYPPNFGCTAPRHGEVHRRTTSALTTFKQLFVQ